MEVRPDILRKLICSVCDEYLSCAPIRMKNDGAALCGRCCDPEDEPTLRITPYEELAQMVVFPCANKSHGCTETLYMTEMQDHEEGCMYRQYVCPVAESGQCDWSGCRNDILDHCTEEHQDKVLQDPCTFQHEIRESNHKTFLLAAFQMLFIIHCKVCLTSMNIYHSVRLIGKSVLASNYELEISRDERKLLDRRDVAPQGCMALQADVSVQVNINTILQLFGDFKDILFKIKLGCKCVKCNKCEVMSVWPTDEGWCCEDCAPVRQLCEYNAKGCTHTDVDIKLIKHEKMHCSYGTMCYICASIVAETHERHYFSQHSDVMHKAGELWRAEVVDEVEDFLITSSIGILYCDYVLEDSKFELCIWSPLHTEQLSNYRCVVTLAHPIAGYTLRKTLPLYYNVWYDWSLVLDEDELLMYVRQNEFDIKIQLIKN